MTLLAATLGDELKALDLYDQEAPSLADWAGAFSTYFEDAQAGPAPIVPVAIEPAEAAFIGAGTGLSMAAAAALTAAITAFWGALPFAVAWPGSLSITPPVGLGTLQAGLEAVFLANTSGSVDKDPSMDAIAAVIHGAQSGGIAVYTPIPGGIGPQTIT